MTIDLTPGHLGCLCCGHSLGLVEEIQQFFVVGVRRATVQRLGDEPKKFIQLTQNWQCLEHQFGRLRRLPPIGASEKLLCDLLSRAVAGVRRAATEAPLPQ